MNDFIERFVLKSTFTSDDVDFVSMRHGWILRQHRRPEAGAYVDVWVTLDRQTEIHQVDDVPIGTRYLTIRGPAHTEVAQQIRRDCTLWSTTEALTTLSATDFSATENRTELLTAVYAAALSATEKDAPQLADAFHPLATHPDPAIRQSIVIATAYFPHPTLIVLVRTLHTSDQTPHIRTNAQHVLAALTTPR